MPRSRGQPSPASPPPSLLVLTTEAGRQMPISPPPSERQDLAPLARATPDLAILPSTVALRAAVPREQAYAPGNLGPVLVRTRGRCGSAFSRDFLSQGRKLRWAAERGPALRGRLRFRPAYLLYPRGGGAGNGEVSAALSAFQRPPALPLAASDAALAFPRTPPQAAPCRPAARALGGRCTESSGRWCWLRLGRPPARLLLVVLRDLSGVKITQAARPVPPPWPDGSLCPEAPRRNRRQRYKLRARLSLLRQFGTVSAGSLGVGLLPSGSE